MGHFPFILRLRKGVGNRWVIEQNPTGDDYPAQSAAALISRADIVALTASSLINHILDNMLAPCSPEALVMILGPSTPLSPVLFDYGATIIAGSRVIDEAVVLNYIAQGATFQQVTCVRLLAITRPGSSPV